jgi:hypothetical protein
MGIAEMIRPRRKKAANSVRRALVGGVEETPLTEALAALLALAQREGVHAVAARLTAEPDALPGLARAVVEAQRSTMMGIWDNSLAPENDHYGCYEKLMQATGLLWCAFLPPPVIGSGQDAETIDRFRIEGDLVEHPSGERLPAVLAPIQDWNRNITGLVRFFVKPDWSGFTDLEPKFTMMGELNGNTIQLRPPGYATMVAIDLEGAASAYERVPSWPPLVTLTAENLAKHFLPPPDVRRLTFWVDAKTFDTALVAARRLYERDGRLDIHFLSDRGQPRHLDEVLTEAEYAEAEADPAALTHDDA